MLGHFSVRRLIRPRSNEIDSNQEGVHQPTVLRNQETHASANLWAACGSIVAARVAKLVVSRSKTSSQIEGRAVVSAANVHGEYPSRKTGSGPKVPDDVGKLPSSLVSPLSLPPREFLEGEGGASWPSVCPTLLAETGTPANAAAPGLAPCVLTTHDTKEQATTLTNENFHEHTIGLI